MVNKVIQRNIHISHRKAQLVCDLIRNKPVKEAIVILKNTDKKFAPICLKLLNSAIANATNNHAMNAEKLYVYNIFANQGPTWKRTMPRARGSADVMFKRTTHLEIHLSDNPKERELELEAIKARKSKGKKPVKKPEPKPEPKPAPKPTPKPKPNDIPVGQKHQVVTVKEFEAYDYDKRRKEWHKKAGYNDVQEVCSICHDDDNWTSIKLENGKHICYFCWIRKPENQKKFEEQQKQQGDK